MGFFKEMVGLDESYDMDVEQILNTRDHDRRAHHMYLLCSIYNLPLQADKIYKSYSEDGDEYDYKYSIKREELDDIAPILIRRMTTKNIMNRFKIYAIVGAMTYGWVTYFLS